MEGIDLKKSDLLEALSSAVMDWNGRTPLRWKAKRRVEALIYSLGLCRRPQPLEDMKLDAIDYCFRQAQESKPADFVRKVWVQEVWSWQQLLVLGAGEDTHPDLPPPNPHEGKGAIEMQAHRFTLPRPLY